MAAWGLGAQEAGGRGGEAWPGPEAPAEQAASGLRRSLVAQEPPLQDEAREGPGAAMEAGLVGRAPGQALLQRPEDWTVGS